MKKTLLIAAVIMLFAFAASAQTSSQSDQNSSGIDKELSNATQIIQQMTGPSANAGIPQNVLDNAKCIAVVPNLIQAGFVVGGRHGSGVATCRTAANQWSSPAPFSLSGASFGAQIGAQSVDLIMMVMNQSGMQALRSGHFKVGGEVSATAGPVGREASASAGWKSGILTYSRSNGAYAGATVKGAEVQQDDSATKALYGSDISFSKILNGQAPQPKTAQAHDFMMAVQHAEQSASQ